MGLPIFGFERGMHTGGTYDVIVIGVGGMGSATVYQLAARGLRVLGLERFRIPNEMGASHGLTRIIRLAYHEGPAYVPFGLRAYELWFLIGFSLPCVDCGAGNPFNAWGLGLGIELLVANGRLKRRQELEPSKWGPPPPTRGDHLEALARAFGWVCLVIGGMLGVEWLVTP